MLLTTAATAPALSSFLSVPESQPEGPGEAEAADAVVAATVTVVAVVVALTGRSGVGVTSPSALHVPAEMERRRSSALHMAIDMERRRVFGISPMTPPRRKSGQLSMLRECPTVVPARGRAEVEEEEEEEDDDDDDDNDDDDNDDEWCSASTDLCTGESGTARAAPSRGSTAAAEEEDEEDAPTPLAIVLALFLIGAEPEPSWSDIDADVEGNEGAAVAEAAEGAVGPGPEREGAGEGARACSRPSCGPAGGEWCAKAEDWDSVSSSFLLSPSFSFPSIIDCMTRIESRAERWEWVDWLLPAPVDCGRGSATAWAEGHMKCCCCCLTRLLHTIRCSACSRDAGVSGSGSTAWSAPCAHDVSTFRLLEWLRLRPAPEPGTERRLFAVLLP